MSYLIDGHNLIPKIPGLRLDAVDDEIQLLELLQEFCRLSRKQVEVYFDRAAQGQSGKQKAGMITVYFVHSGTTADRAISQRLHRMGRSARNWTVISSDKGVQNASREAGAEVLSSEEFASLLRKAFAQSSAGEDKPAQPDLSPDEVDEWLKVFKTKRRGET